MPPVLSKSDSSTKRGQTREVVLNVYNFMKKETQLAKGQVPEHYEKQAIASAEDSRKGTKVSERTFRRILGEQKSSKPKELLSVHQSRHTKCRNVLTDVDDFDKCLIRRTICESYVQKKILPTIPKLLSNLRDRVNFKGCRHSLWRFVMRLGFRWKTTKNNRMVLIEKHYRTTTF